jgi:hypothetical protein
LLTQQTISIFFSNCDLKRKVIVDLIEVVQLDKVTAYLEQFFVYKLVFVTKILTEMILCTLFGTVTKNYLRGRHHRSCELFL